MCDAVAIRMFLSDVIHHHSRLHNLPPPSCDSLDTWSFYFSKHLDLNCIAVNRGDQLALNFPLLLARHPVYGPVLLRVQPQLFRNPKIHLLSLDSGETHAISEIEVTELSEAQLLFEYYRPEGRVSAGDIGAYIARPARGLRRQALLLQGLITFASSLFFIINYNTLVYVVPGLSLGAWGAVAWLVLALVLGLSLTQFVSARVNLYLDSLAEERQEITRLALLWSLVPQFVESQGPMRTMALCGTLAKAGRTLSEIHLSAVGALFLVPILVLMYLRLPSALFFITLALALLSTAIQVWLFLAKHRRSSELAMDDAENSHFLMEILSHSARLKFYRHTNFLLDRLRGRLVQAAARHAGLARGAALSDNIATGLTGLLQMIGIFAVSLIVSASNIGGHVLTIDEAFIILHLVSSTYMLVPRVSEVIRQLGAVRIDLKSAAALIDHQERRNAPSQVQVGTANVSVRCSNLKLPHGCAFDADQGVLDCNLSGSGVIQVEGESGSGKSTFLRCLLGLEQPLAGQILVMGAAPAELSQQERSQIFSYVSQNVQLLPGNLRDNLKLFGTSELHERQVWEILDRVMLVEKVRRLPLGLDTPITDARRSFSTGERQRMVLAQALIKKSAVLVLDEAMSGLPAESELQVFGNIRDMVTQIFFVSHRNHLSDLADHRISLRNPTGTT